MASWASWTMRFNELTSRRAAPMPTKNEAEVVGPAKDGLAIEATKVFENIGPGLAAVELDCSFLFKRIETVP